MEWLEVELPHSTRWVAKSFLYQGVIAKVFADPEFGVYIDNRFKGSSSTLSGAKEIAKQAIISHIHALTAEMGDEARSPEHLRWNALVTHGVKFEADNTFSFNQRQIEPWTNDLGVKALIKHAETLRSLPTLPE